MAGDAARAQFGERGGGVWLGFVAQDKGSLKTVFVAQHDDAARGQAVGQVFRLPLWRAGGDLGNKVGAPNRPCLLRDLGGDALPHMVLPLAGDGLRRGVRQPEKRLGDGMLGLVF